METGAGGAASRETHLHTRRQGPIERPNPSSTPHTLAHHAANTCTITTATRISLVPRPNDTISAGKSTCGWCRQTSPLTLCGWASRRPTLHSQPHVEYRMERWSGAALMLDDVNYIKRDGMTVQSQCHGCQEAKGGGLGWGPQSSWASRK
jgi:hypothetical protein